MIKWRKVAILLLLILGSTSSSQADKGLSSENVELPKTIETPYNPDTDKSNQKSEESDDDNSSFLGKITVTISSISPSHGPTTGDTRVVVRGGPFKAYQKLYPDPKCRFGSDDKQVSATYVACPEKQPKYFEKEGRKINRTSICIQCENSPASKEVKPVSFQISLDGTFDDVKTSAQFYYYRPPKASAIKPQHGPKDGETTVQVWGENFKDFGEDTTCSFGVKSVPAKVHDKGYITCVSPSSDVVQRRMPFSVSLNGQQQTKDSLYYWYYNDPQVTVVDPDLGPESGGNTVTLRGQNYKPFNVEEGDLDISNSTFCFFKALGIYKRATILNSTRATCVVPPSYYYRETAVEITLNAADRTEDNTLYHYYKPPFLFDVNPRQGPVKGGTKVTVIGTNFTNTGNITCKFGKNEVPGKYKSSSEITCTSPAAASAGYVDLTISMYKGLYSSPVQYLYYDIPKIQSILPVSGPDYGLTQCVLTGENFVDLGGDNTVCVWNKTTFTNATVMSKTQIICDSPSMIDKQGYSRLKNDYAFYDVEVSIDGGREITESEVQFAYYKEPQIQSISPSLGPISGGTNVTIKGQGFLQKAVSKRVIRIGHMVVEPDSFTNQTITFTAPEVSVENTAPLAISLNGQQFTRQNKVHNYGEGEIQYDYYNVPYTSFYQPQRGPTNGGTQMVVEGYGYRLKRPHLRDNFWVRLVDTDSNLLAAASKITDKDFEFDKFTWTTPAVSTTSSAVMQVSLNNQDWHDAKDPNSDGFNFYTAPHITNINPSFGHVKSKKTQEIILTGSGFSCVDKDCEELKCRFGNKAGQYVYVKADFVSNTQIKCNVPTYTRPDVVNVEVTINDESYTNDNKTYGFFDPFVLDANPRLIATDGSTKVDIKGIGFVNSGQTKSLFNNKTNQIVCGKDNCTKEATFIDKNTLQTATYPQSEVTYKSSGTNVKWDPMNIDATVIGEDYTENDVEIYYYEDPELVGINIQETPSNLESQLLLNMNFKSNDMAIIEMYAKPKCRFTYNSKQSYSDGRLVAYPMTGSRDPSKLNTIHCKSPRWTLDGNDAEKSSLSVSINGQNFIGGLDFTFTKDIILHRDIPMAGPIQVQSNVTLIGQGYKMTNRTADIKWGIQGSQNIPSSNVTDYTYNQESFYNFIPGNEELKAYFGEVTMKKVDSSISEDITTDSTNQTSLLYDKDGIREGPGYLEIGLIQQLNITKDNIPTTLSLYEFQQSSVEFYTYKDPTILRMSPTSGLTKGGTQVTVIGYWFKFMPEYGIIPHCRFGNKIVRAYFDSTVRLICQSPPMADVTQSVAFSISLNGVDWDDSNNFQYNYYDEPIINDIWPDMGPVTGGDEIFIKGEKFSNITDPKTFNCRFTPTSLNIPPKTAQAHYINSTTIKCFSPGGWSEADKVHLQVTWNGIDYDSNNFQYSFFSISKANPRSGPSNGKGGDIIIYGQGFRDDTDPKCLLNDTQYDPLSINTTHIKCPMPAADDESYFGNVNLAISANGRTWHYFEGGFQYYQQPTVEDIDPKTGPNSGVSIINFYGQNFRADYPLAELGCKVGQVYGKAYYVSPRQVKCLVQDLPLLAEDEDALPASVSLNSYSYSDVTEETYFRPYGVQSIRPNSGPIGGLTQVIVTGQGFVAEEGVTPRCRFGTTANYAIVEAEILSYSRLACRTPETLAQTPTSAMPRDVPFSLAISGDEFQPWTLSSHKFRFYNQPKLASIDPEEANVGTIVPVYLSVSEESEFFEPMPQSQTIALDNRIISVQGDNQKGQANTEVSIIKCKFGRFGESSGVMMNSTSVKCTTPATDESPDNVYRETVYVSVAMNGQDFMEDSSSAEFTFVGSAPYISFAAIVLAILAIGFVIYATASLQAIRSQLDALLASRQQASQVPNIDVPRPGSVGGFNHSRSAADRHLRQAEGQSRQNYSNYDGQQ